MDKISRNTVSKDLGIGSKTLRNYEKKGILTPQRAENGYLYYDVKNYYKAMQIKVLQMCNFNSEQIQSIIQLPPDERYLEIAEYINTSIRDFAYDVIEALLRISHVIKMTLFIKLINNVGNENNLENMEIKFKELKEVYGENGKDSFEKSPKMMVYEFLDWIGPAFNKIIDEFGDMTIKDFFDEKFGKLSSNVEFYQNFINGVTDNYDEVAKMCVIHFEYMLSLSKEPGEWHKIDGLLAIKPLFVYYLQSLELFCDDEKKFERVKFILDEINKYIDTLLSLVNIDDFKQKGDDCYAL